MHYVFGDYTLDTERYELYRTGVRLRIEPRVFDLLAYLVQHPGHIVTKDELLAQLWSDQSSGFDGRLTTCVAQVRRVLGDTSQEQRYIQTVYNRGYRFIGLVTTRLHGEDNRPASADPPQPRPRAAHDLAPAKTGLAPEVIPPVPPVVPQHGGGLAHTFHPTGPGLLAAERRQLTVVVCHMQGVAELAARDPEALLNVTQAYHTMCAAVVDQFAGHIAQVQGDGLVVYFGSPQTHEDDARRAIQTGLGIVEGLARLQQRHTQDWGVQLAAQVGIHTGPVVVSILGQGTHQEPLALGMTPAIAAQIQGLAAPNTVMISATTQRLVARDFVCQPAGTPHRDAFSPPLTMYQVLQASSAQSTPELTPLVGRVQEIGLLRERWMQAKDGQGQVVVLSGEAGIGKSRLAQALKEHLAGEAYTRIECHCSPYYQQSALYPIVEYLRRLLQWRGGETPEEQLHTLEAALAPLDLPLEEVVPLFAALLLLPLSARYTPQPLTPAQQKQQTFEALLAWLFQKAERQPVCCIIEDLHWVDPSTLEWLCLLIDQLPTARVLLLLLCRPDFHSPWVMHSHCTHLPLGRLSSQQTVEMIAQVVGDTLLPAEIVQQVAVTTDGIPLFVEELTKMVLESGLVKEREGQYALAGPLPSLTIPATLHDSLIARLDRLGPAKQVAYLGAVVGREFTYEVLQAVAPMEEAVLQQGLAQLVNAELLYQRGLPPQARYRFKHVLIQEAAYHTLLQSTRRQYHRHIAQVLEDRWPGTCQHHPELVAHHYTEAGCSAQALPYWQQAGQRAMERSANLEAIGHLTQGLEVLKTLPETPERAWQELSLQLTLGAPLSTVKGHAAPDVEHAYSRAYELAQQVGDSAHLCAALEGLSRMYLNRAQLQTARELGERFFTLAQSMHDPALRQEAHLMLGSTLLFLGELVAARSHLEHGIALYNAQRDRARAFRRGTDPGVVCLARVSQTLWLLGYPEQALKRGYEALTLAQELSHVYSVGIALEKVTVLHRWRREVPLLQERVETLTSLAREQGFVRLLSEGMIRRGWARVEQGAAEEGLADLNQGLASLRATGVALTLSELLAMLAEAYRKGGDPEEGLSVLAEALAVVNTSGENFWAAELYRLKGELLLGLSVDPTAAATCFCQALEIARYQQAKSLELRTAMSLSRLLQHQGKVAKARQLLEEVYGWFTEGFDTADLEEAKTLLEELGREIG